jgi:hypothetical protein
MDVRGVAPESSIQFTGFNIPEMDITKGAGCADASVRRTGQCQNAIFWCSGQAESAVGRKFPNPHGRVRSPRSQQAAIWGETNGFDRSTRAGDTVPLLAIFDVPQYQVARLVWGPATTTHANSNLFPVRAEGNAPYGTFKHMRRANCFSRTNIPHADGSIIPTGC